jgi:A/G-specific adenine glycosylase
MSGSLLFWRGFAMLQDSFATRLVAWQEGTAGTICPGR